MGETQMNAELEQRLAALIGRPQPGADLRLRQGVVVSVEAGGTATIRLGGSTDDADNIVGVRMLAAVAAGDTCHVLQTGGALLILGSIDTGWLTPTLLNGWTVYDATWGNAAMYRKVNGVVYLRGLVRTGTLAADMFVLPAGFRPTIQLLFACVSVDAICRVEVYPSGAVKNGAGGNNAWISLNGVTFPAG